MEPVENALKGSFIKEPSLKLDHQTVLHDLPCATASDDFSVDDLLDFSKMSGCGGEESSLNGVDETQTPAKTSEMETGQNGVAEKKETSEICVPTDDVADLEWLSHFVEDSFTDYSLTCPLPVKTTTIAATPAEKTLPVEASGKPPRATRSKRARNGVGLGWSYSGSETASSTSSSSSSSTASFSSASAWLIYANQTTQNQNDAVFHSSSFSPPKTAAIMKKKRKSNSYKPSTGNKLSQPRRCSHCGVQKTPQWRAGPLGAKTLCNACGVRFKSGRLLPEYRPACSPTFSSELHSNSHRKVLEMRHKKEVELPESGRVPAVPSF